MLRKSCLDKRVFIKEQPVNDQFLAPCKEKQIIVHVWWDLGFN